MNTQSSTPVLENLTGFTFCIHDMPDSINAFTWSASDECKQTFLTKWKESLTALQNEDVLNKKQPAKELHILHDMQEC